MQAVGVLALLLLAGCATLIADFEEDRVGAAPSIRPAGYPDDEIRLSFPFQGAVRGAPVPDPTGVRSGRQSLEVSGNSSITFRSEAIPAQLQTARHTLSFLFTDATARGKTILFSGGAGSSVWFRLADDTLTIRGSDRRDERDFPIRTLSTPALVTIVVTPATGRINVTWRTATETVTWATAYATPGDGRVTRLALQVAMDNGGNFPRGLVRIDDVRASWALRFTVGGTG